MSVSSQWSVLGDCVGYMALFDIRLSCSTAAYLDDIRLAQASLCLLPTVGWWCFFLCIIVFCLQIRSVWLEEEELGGDGVEKGLVIIWESFLLPFLWKSVL